MNPMTHYNGAQTAVGTGTKFYRRRSSVLYSDEYRHGYDVEISHRSPNYHVRLE